MGEVITKYIVQSLMLILLAIYQMALLGKFDKERKK